MTSSQSLLGKSQLRPEGALSKQEQQSVTIQRAIDVLRGVEDAALGKPRKSERDFKVLCGVARVALDAFSSSLRQFNAGFPQNGTYLATAGQSALLLLKTPYTPRAQGPKLLVEMVNALESAYKCFPSIKGFGGDSVEALAELTKAAEKALEIGKIA